MRNRDSTENSVQSDLKSVRFSRDTTNNLLTFKFFFSRHVSPHTSALAASIPSRIALNIPRDHWLIRGDGCLEQLDRLGMRITETSLSCKAIRSPFRKIPVGRKQLSIQGTRLAVAVQVYRLSRDRSRVCSQSRVLFSSITSDSPRPSLLTLQPNVNSVVKNGDRKREV